MQGIRSVEKDYPIHPLVLENARDDVCDNHPVCRLKVGTCLDHHWHYNQFDAWKLAQVRKKSTRSIRKNRNALLIGNCAYGTACRKEVDKFFLLSFHFNRFHV